MENLLIRNLDPELVEQLKSRAKRNGRSLSEEVKQILVTASGVEIGSTDQIRDDHNR